MNNAYQSNGNTALKQNEIYEYDMTRQSMLDIQNLQSTRVLLVEDDRTTRRMVSKAIGDYCRLIEAYSAGKAIARYKNFAPDIVFLDLELPDDNGHNILKWIMYNDPGAHVVLFSGHCDRHNVEKAMNNGAKGYVSKPFDIDLMMYYISQCPKLH